MRSLLNLGAEVVLLEVGRLEYFDFDFGVVVEFGLERLGAFGLGHTHVVVVPPVLQHINYNTKIYV